MTKAQRVSLMAELWPEACRTQGWHEDDRELRLVVCSIAVSGIVAQASRLSGSPITSMEQWLEAFHSAEAPARVLKSTNELDDREDFTRVKNLLRLLSDRVENADEQTRRMRFVVEQQTRCIAVYLRTGALDPAYAYVKSIIRDRFNRLHVEDLNNAQLRQLMMTLQNRLHNKRTGLRVQAGDTMHDMCQKAHIKCHCKACATPANGEEPF